MSTFDLSNIFDTSNDLHGSYADEDRFGWLHLNRLEPVSTVFSNNQVLSTSCDPDAADRAASHQAPSPPPPPVADEFDEEAFNRRHFAAYVPMGPVRPKTQEELELEADPEFVPEEEEDDDDDDGGDEEREQQVEQVEEELIMDSTTIDTFLQDNQTPPSICASAAKPKKTSKKTSPKKRRLAPVAASSGVQTTRNGTACIPRARQIAKHTRNTPRGIKTLIEATRGNEEAQAVIDAAWKKSVAGTSKSWKNWAEEMFNAALHVVCRYFERFSDAIAQGQVEAKAAFAEAKFALEAFGSYDGKQPHTQLNREIFTFVTDQFGKWIDEQFCGNFAEFAKHILGLFNSGEISTDGQIELLRSNCRASIAEPRTFSTELRRSIQSSSNPNNKRRRLDNDNDSASTTTTTTTTTTKKSAPRDFRRFTAMPNCVVTPQKPVKVGSAQDRSQQVVGGSHSRSSNGSSSSSSATASTTDYRRRVQSTLLQTNTTIQTVDSLRNRNRLLKDLAAALEAE